MISIMALTVMTVAVTAKPVSAASTQVLAAPSPPRLNVATVGAPAVCWDNIGNFFLFTKGADGALWYRQWNSATGWSASQSLGGYLTSDPAAVSQISIGSIVDVYVRGGDGALWTKSYSAYSASVAGSWSGWSRIGGQLLAGTGPTAYSWYDSNNQHLGWFVTGTNHALYHMWMDATGTHGWENDGGYLTSSPAATSQAPGKIDVYVRGGDSALWQKEYSNGGWGSWASLGGRIYPGTAPAACSWGQGHLDVFVEGMNGALYNRFFDGSWSAWQSLGGYLTSSPAAATSFGAINVFVRGGDGGLWLISYNGESWSGWKS